MLDEFEFMGEEVDHIQHFDRLIDSGLMQKARHIKHTFGPAFYHPHALATIAPYNDSFGRRFAELFTSAAAHIKCFADDIQQRGGSLSSRVDGDITVQHLAQVEEQNHSRDRIPPCPGPLSPRIPPQKGCGLPNSHSPPGRRAEAPVLQPCHAVILCARVVALRGYVFRRFAAALLHQSRSASGGDPHPFGRGLDS